MPKKKPFKNLANAADRKARLTAWREARVESYLKRSQESLARMLVELEDSTDSSPEFDIDDEWPR